jgi:hypothetical protein
MMTNGYKGALLSIGSSRSLEGELFTYCPCFSRSEHQDVETIGESMPLCAVTAQDTAYPRSEGPGRFSRDVSCRRQERFTDVCAM